MRRRSEIRSKGRRQFYLWKKSRKEVAKHDADIEVGSIERVREWRD